MGKNKFMSQFIEKTLIKWSVITVLGVSAYLMGYFWGIKNVEGDSKATLIGQEVLEQPAHLSELKERVH